MAPKLALNGLTKRFGDLEVLRDIDVAIERGEFISLVGPSGCGKTTLLRIVAGLEPASAGAVLLDGRAVREPGGDRGFVFQSDNLLPWRTVFDNAIIGPEVAGRAGAAEKRRIARPAAAGRPRRLRELLPAPALRRHAPARQSRPRARDRSRHPPDGRAVLGARRPDPRDHADRADAHLGEGPQDRAVRHPPDRRGGVPVGPRAGAGAPARPRPGNRRDRAAAAAGAGRSSARRNSSPMSTASGG